MLFDVWGSNTLTHWLGWAMVFVGLIVLNEVGRRTKVGAAIIFGVAPLAMTIYCAAIAFGVANGQEWALTASCIWPVVSVVVRLTSVPA